MAAQGEQMKSLETLEFGMGFRSGGIETGDGAEFLYSNGISLSADRNFRNANFKAFQQQIHMFEELGGRDLGGELGSRAMLQNRRIVEWECFGTGGEEVSQIVGYFGGSMMLGSWEGLDVVWGQRMIGLDLHVVDFILQNPCYRDRAYEPRNITSIKRHHPRFPLPLLIPALTRGSIDHSLLIFTSLSHPPKYDAKSRPSDTSSVDYSLLGILHWCMRHSQRFTCIQSTHVSVEPRLGFCCLPILSYILILCTPNSGAKLSHIASRYSGVQRIKRMRERAGCSGAPEKIILEKRAQKNASFFKGCSTFLVMLGDAVTLVILSSQIAVEGGRKVVRVCLIPDDTGMQLSEESIKGRTSFGVLLRLKDLEYCNPAFGSALIPVHTAKVEPQGSRWVLCSHQHGRERHPRVSRARHSFQMILPGCVAHPYANRDGLLIWITRIVKSPRLVAPTPAKLAPTSCNDHKCNGEHFTTCLLRHGNCESGFKPQFESVILNTRWALINQLVNRPARSAGRRYEHFYSLLSVIAEKFPPSHTLWAIILEVKPILHLTNVAVIAAAKSINEKMSSGENGDQEEGSAHSQIKESRLDRKVVVVEGLFEEDVERDVTVLRLNFKPGSSHSLVVGLA
ncbi:uncharacterized protein BDR25DRAFT_350055 [Lindgomyces ingoldianus]|uniref:Uncharacterized protein n=1 Tax=Lindgomyces ingoldianus TaxID=673940 RepID=A0ACB6R914_9PLEO|nr:uncharacterized protein BDR25DRAFT_350055 [Lindgomyces ingoldianus]KAF2475768.1 hypothetical protein BDR25DRAFT_350055 [Lindgomyces ingoldianus]